MDELKRSIKYDELIEDIKNNALYDKDLTGTFKASLIVDILNNKKYKSLTLKSKEVAYLFKLLWES